jgi:membrane fusion protein (multidrug efflux system)
MQPGNFLRRVALLVLLGLGLGLQACERTAAPPQPSGPIPVTVVTHQAQPVTLTRELNGRTSPFLVAEIRPQVNGIIERRLFEEGGLVQAGQPLYQIDDAVYRANLASAQASLAQAEATRESARATAARMSKLIKTNAVSRQDYDNAVAAVGSAVAQVKVAQAAVRSSQIELGYARITSPISGRVGRSTVTQGALVTANQASALTTVQQLDPINVDLTMSASELLQLRQELAAGTVSKVDEVPVTILLENRTRYPHQGKLTFADLTVEPTTGSFLLQVVVPNPETLLLPGMYVRAVVALARRPQAVLAPQQGITRDPKGNATALVVTADNRVELRQVKVIRTIGDQWLIVSGLAAGDRVIVAGLQKVRPGAVVLPTEAAPAAQAGAGQGPPAAGGGR